MPIRWPYCRLPTREHCLERRKPARLASIRLALLVPAVGMYSSDTGRVKRSSGGYPPMRGECTSQALRQLSLELFWNARQTPCQRTAYLPTTDTGEQREKRACAGKFLPDIFSVCFKDGEGTSHPPLVPYDIHTSLR